MIQNQIFCEKVEVTQLISHKLLILRKTKVPHKKNGIQVKIQMVQ